MEINLVLAIIILFLLFLVFPTTFIIVFFNNKKVQHLLGWIFFVSYLLMLSLLVLGKVVISSDKIYWYFSIEEKWFNISFLWADFGVMNIILNLVMLFPISAFLFLQHYKNIFIKTIIFSFLISLFIELLQFILPVSRCTEIFDIFLNVFSGIIGYIYFKCINILVSKIVENKKLKL